MRKSDIRHLLVSDQGIPADRHDVIKERVMSSIRPDESESPARRRFRRLVPTLAGVSLLAVAATGAAVALGLFPQQTRDILDEFGCRSAASVEEVVASAQAVDGRTFQFWVTRATEDAPPNGWIVVTLNPNGSMLGSTLGCSQPDEGRQVYATSEIWATAPNEIGTDGALAYVIGYAPPGAVVVTVTFSDGTTSDIEVQPNGHFLGLVSRPDINLRRDPEGDFLNFDVMFPDVVHVAAFGADGALIAEDGLPWGP